MCEIFKQMFLGKAWGVQVGKQKLGCVLVSNLPLQLGTVTEHSLPMVWIYPNSKSLRI